MPDNQNQVDAQRVFSQLGEIKGSLDSVKDLIKLSHEATNKRIDDLAENVRDQTRALNTRIDDHSNRIDSHDTHIQKLQEQVTAGKRNNLLASGGTSAFVAACAQVIKELLQ